MATDETTTGDQKKHYFVDEAGDPVLFNRRKQIVVGRESDHVNRRTFEQGNRWFAPCAARGLNCRVAA